MTSTSPLAETRAHRVRDAALFQAVFVAGVTVLKAASTAMVVARLSAEALPPIYIAAALLTAALAPAQGALVRSHAPPRLVLPASALLAVALGALSLDGWSFAVVALYLFAEVYATLLSLRFWATVGELFDARESKRAFALISGGGMAGSIFGGLVARLVGVRVGVSGFLLVALLSMLACRILSGRLDPGGRVTAARPLGTGLPGARASFALLSRDRYARGVAIGVAALSALTVCVDFVFRLRAGETLGENELAALFGEVNLWVGVVAVLFQFLVAGRLLARFGIFRYLLFVPVCSLGLGVTGLLTPALWPVFALKVLETAGNLSINPTAIQLLYGPLPDEARVVARSAIDGFVKKGGLALGGVLLLVMGGFSGVPTAEILVGLSALTAAIAVGRIKPLYVAALDARLARAHWSGEGIDEHAQQTLLAALESPKHRRALLAMSLLEKSSVEALRAKLPELLVHPDARVREKAAKLAGKLGAVETVPRLAEMARAETERGRYDAARAIGALANNATELLRPLMAASDVELRGAVIGSLVRHELSLGRHDGLAHRALQEMLASASWSSAAERRATALVLADVAESGAMRSVYAHHLETYLRDRDPGVRIAAASAAGRTRLINVVPCLVEMLGRPAERRAAREALASYGEEVVPVLAYILNDRHAPSSMRYEVPRLLRYIGGERAAEVLLFSNTQDDPILRIRIAHALSRMRKHDPTLRVDAERVEQAIGRRVDAFLYYRGVASELTGLLPANALLLRTLRDRLDQNTEIIFRLLTLIFPYDTVARAYRRFCAGSARQRACAVELLDNLLTPSLRSRVAPVLETPAADRPLSDMSSVVARLAELATSKDPVLAGITLHTATLLFPQTMPFPIPQEEFVSESTIDKVFLIEGINIFANSGVDDLVALAALAQERRYEKDEVIYEHGSPGDAVYIIVDGAVRMERDGRTILVLGRTESFGEASLLDGRPHVAMAVAQEPTRVLWIDRQDFLELVSDRPELLKCVFAAVTRTMRRVIDAAASQTNQAEERGAEQGAAHARESVS